MNINDISLTGVSQEQPKVTKKEGIWPFFVGLGISLVVIVIGCLIYFSSTGPEAVLNKWKEGNMNWDSEKIVSLIHPDVLEEWEKDYDELYGLPYTSLHKKNFKEGAEIGSITSIEIDYDDYEVYDGKKFDTIKDEYLDDLDKYKYDVEEIRCYSASFEMVLKEDTSISDSRDIYVVIIKIDGKWYLASESLES